MDGSELYVIFKIKDQCYAILAKQVREMVALPKTRSVPVAADYFRGVINLRSEVLRVVDTRMLFGMKTLPEESSQLAQLLSQREQDHVNWITTLEKCVRDKTPFTLALDPHQCAFGKWYDHYDNENIVVSQTLKEFDEPHKKIHALAEKAFALIADQHEKEAQALISHAHNHELAALVQLFKKLRRLLDETLREIGMVVLTKSQPYVLTTDSILSVEHLQPNDQQDMKNILTGPNAGSNLIAAVSELKQPVHTLVLILDPQALETLL